MNELESIIGRLENQGIPVDKTLLAQATNSSCVGYWHINPSMRCQSMNFPQTTPQALRVGHPRPEMPARYREPGEAPLPLNQPSRSSVS